MTESDIIHILGKHFVNEQTHPAWKSFIKIMQNRFYSYDALLQAWLFFREGWESEDEK